jgi:hypothetical protein
MRSEIMRAMVSFVPPGARGTTNRIGRLGNVCARLAILVAANTAPATIVVVPCMVLSSSRIC